MQNNEYTTGMTGNPFLFRETRIVANLICHGVSGQELNRLIINQNAFQCDKKSTNMKHFAEIKLRLSLISSELVNIINSDDIEKVRLVIFYALLIRYRLLREFMLEVIYEKKINMENSVMLSEINMWLNHKKEHEKQLNALSDNTAQKVRQVLIKIAVEAGLLQKKKDKIMILNVIVPEFLLDEIKKHGDIQYLKYFLVR